MTFEERLMSPLFDGSEDDLVLVRLCDTLEKFDRLPHIGGAEPSPEDNTVYDKLKAVLAEHALAQFGALFESGRLHLIRRLAEVMRAQLVIDCVECGSWHVPPQGRQQWQCPRCGKINERAVTGLTAAPI